MGNSLLTGSSGVHLDFDIDIARQGCNGKALT